MVNEMNGNSSPRTVTSTDIINSKLHTMNNVSSKDIHVSETINELNAPDQVVLDNEASKKRTLKEIQSSGLFKRTSQCFNKHNDELIVPSNSQKDKYDIEKIGTSKNNAVKLRRFPNDAFLDQPSKKKMKFEENVNYSSFPNNNRRSGDRGSKSLTYLEIEMLLESSCSSNESMLDNDITDVVDLKSPLVINQSEHFIKNEQFIPDTFFFGSENCPSDLGTRLFEFYEVNNSSGSNVNNSSESDSSHTGETEMNYNSECNVLKLITELSHSVDNGITLENENTETNNEKVCTKEFENSRDSSSASHDVIDLCNKDFQSNKVDESVILWDKIVMHDISDCSSISKGITICKRDSKNSTNQNLMNSSSTFHDVYNLCDEELHSNTVDDSIILLDEIVLNNDINYSISNNDNIQCINDYKSSNLKEPTEFCHQINDIIILENENMGITNEQVFIKDFKNSRDSSNTYHEVIDVCNEEFQSNKVDKSFMMWDKIVMLDISDSNDISSSKNIDIPMCKKDSKTLTRQNLIESFSTVHDVIDLCDKEFHSNKIDGNITLLDEKVLDDDTNYSIINNDNTLCINQSDLSDLELSTVLPQQEVDDEIILENENMGITNNKVFIKDSKNSRDSSSVFHDVINLSNEECQSNKFNDSVTHRIVMHDISDCSTKSINTTMCKKNHESLSCNPVECNKSNNSFDNNINISSPNNDGGAITDLNKTFLSFSTSEIDRILESSDGISESSDISLLFMPSEGDILKYKIEDFKEDEENQTEVKDKKKEAEESISRLKYHSNDHIKSSSVAKDGEDNVTFFYDCDLSSIENSDVEEDYKDHETKLSSENHTSFNHGFLKKNKEQSENANSNSSSIDQTICHGQLKSQNSEFVHSSTTNIVKDANLSIHSPHNDHKYNEIVARSPSYYHDQHNKCEVQCCMANPSINVNVLKPLDIDPVNESCSNIKPIGKKYIMPICSSSPDKNKIQFDNLCNDKTNLNDEIKIKWNENETEKKPDIDGLHLEDSISPYISQSLANSISSQNLKNALGKKATANTDVNAMGDKTLSTYLTQQTMTLDVLRILHKSLDTCPSSSVLMDDPKGLVVPLMSHQKHAIAWLIWRENQEPRGGILADDMGLGKTLSMISLVLKSEENQDPDLIVSNDDNTNDRINGGTLVICPASLLSQWENEVKTKLSPGRLNVGQYYGVNRRTSAFELAKYDIVTTSYNIIMWDYKKQQDSQDSSPLFKVNWRRIILDEAHKIRNHKTLTSIAVCSMTGINRWALTGTPIHNKEADFFTLLKFIGCKPFDDLLVWKRWVGNNDSAGKHRQSLLVKTLMLRRTKKELSQFTSFNLPSKTIHTVEIELSKEERSAYIQLLQFSSRLFATYLFDRVSKAKLVDSDIDVQCKVQYFQEQSQEKEKIFKDHPELLKLFKKFKDIVEVQPYHILVLFLRLRQICCHPCLIKGRITENYGDVIPKNEDLSDNDALDDDNVSGFLFNDHTTNVATPNLNDEMTDLSDLMSSLSLKNEEPDEKMSAPINNDDIFKKSWQSSKIKAVCNKVWEKVLKDDGREKAIIVSQWPSMLYLIRLHLLKYDVKMEMFSGSIPLLKRNTIIRKFNKTNSGPQILLLSLTAGGVGLNLMAANHMFMVDVHWNPQLEAQACDRIYRVGQTKPVNVYKFICTNTIETKILLIQDRKLKIAQNLFEGGASVVSSKITMEDLRTIFQM